MPDTEPERQDPEMLRKVGAARDIWISRLIDPSRSNSLLFYRDLKIGTLDLSTYTEAVRRLLSGEFLNVESLVEEEVGRKESDADSATQAQQKARKVFVAIQRKALENREEKGIETLHIALGLATWPATDGGRPHEAPVIYFQPKLRPAAVEVMISVFQ